MSTNTKNREVLFNEPKKEMSDAFLKEFAARYYELKDVGILPKQIVGIMTEELNCKKSSYYRYLREARNAKFVTDSYEETHNEAILRSKGQSSSQIALIVEPSFLAPDQFATQTTFGQDLDGDYDGDLEPYPTIDSINANIKGIVELGDVVDSGSTLNINGRVTTAIPNRNVTVADKYTTIDGGATSISTADYPWVGKGVAIPAKDNHIFCPDAQPISTVETLQVEEKVLDVLGNTLSSTTTKPLIVATNVDHPDAVVPMTMEELQDAMGELQPFPPQFEGSIVVSEDTGGLSVERLKELATIDTEQTMDKLKEWALSDDSVSTEDINSVDGVHMWDENPTTTPLRTETAKETPKVNFVGQLISGFKKIFGLNKKI